MAKKTGLGRGLNAIFQDHKVFETETDSPIGESIQEIPVKDISPNPYQPRTHFSEEGLTELAESIHEHGLLEPILVRKHSTGYQIVAGERRFKAHLINDSTTIPARVYEQLSDRKMMEWALIENTQREQLSPIEEARAYQKLIQEHGYTHEKLAKSMGKSRSAISNCLRLLKLPESVQEFLADGKITAGHARALLSPDIKDPEAEALKIINQGSSVRDTESITKPPQVKVSKPKDPNLTYFENELRYKLGTEINIQKKKGNRGSLEITFNDDDDLTRIITSILENT